ncbi:MAG: hemerythrin domain-containing protein [Patescibacteria group bacterium]
MSEATQILSDEHQNILRVIKSLENECAEIEAGKKVDKDFFYQAVGFIRNYADKFHHAKEEDILFKEMCQDEVNLHCNPVEQMLYEHNLGRDFVKNLETGLTEDNQEKILANARGYASLLAEHIFKEDNVLYPIADQALSSEVQRTMAEKFLAVENEKFTPEIKGKYLALINEFESRK